MPKRKEVTIQKDGVETQVLDISVPTWEKHGWTVVDDGSSETEEDMGSLRNQAGAEVAPVETEEND